MTVRRLGSLAVVLLVAGLAFGQGVPTKDAKAPKEPPKPAPGSLEDTLEKALRNSADIKAAEAKVRDAEAELNRVRHQVLTKATALHADLNLAKRMLAVAEQTMAAHAELHKTGVKSGTEGILAAQAMVEKHRGEVEKLQTELKALRGEFALPHHMGDVRNVAFDRDGRFLAGAGPDGTVRIWDATSGLLLTDVKGTARIGAAAVQPSMGERIRKFLETEVAFEDLTGKGDLPVRDLADLLLKLAKTDIPIHRVPPAGDARWRADPDVKGKLPVAAVLQMVEDQSSDVRIVVREYGLLVTDKDRVPEGALGVIDFWKRKEAKSTTDSKRSEKK